MARLVLAEGRSHRTEVYEARLLAGNDYASLHPPGTEELVYCVTGSLRIGPESIMSYPPYGWRNSDWRRAMKTVIHTPNAVLPLGPFAQAVRAGEFLFISGTVPYDSATERVVGGEIEEQTAHVTFFGDYTPARMTTRPAATGFPGRHRRDRPPLRQVAVLGARLLGWR